MIRVMVKFSILLLLQFAIAFPAIAQLQDTLEGKIASVLVTATRYERSLNNVTVPASILTKKNITQAGSLRLNDILREQTGLNITSGFGAGVQLQGLGADYTLILINGEPLVGRTGGVLDLNRITIGNIKKIEIIKGPSSSLYGSEALAGVINIITNQPQKASLGVTTRYGTYATFDGAIEGGFTNKAFSYSGFGNYFATNGYSIRPSSSDRTVAPIKRFTTQHQMGYRFNSKSRINAQIRYNYEDITNIISVGNTGSVTNSNGKEINEDVNLQLNYSYDVNKFIKSQMRVYGTQFISNQNLFTASGSPYSDYLRHQFFRAENQTNIIASTKVDIVAGAGYINEGVNSTRYQSKDQRKENNIAYAFSQAEYRYKTKLILVAGLRYDENRLFESAWSPKISARYNLNTKWSFLASVGRGFKAPDFRQLYLSFTNTAAGSYSVFGAIEAQQKITELNQVGVIASYTGDYAKLSSLKPEYSTGINATIQFNTNHKIKASINFFRNQIQNLIDTRVVAFYNNGAQIFSYLNVNNAFTQGAEVEAQYQLFSFITINAGYQLLLTGDKDEVKQIKAGNVFTKDASGFSRRMTMSEYIGLPNRSKHTANLKILYEQKTWFVNARLLYRSKWAVGDKDGNGVYNTNDEFAQGYLQFNIAAGKTLKKGFRAQVGCDNITNYTDVNYLPNLPGRTFYATLAWNWKK
jgi:outer membrane receptor for ferrienterochelin and colicins